MTGEGGSETDQSKPAHVVERARLELNLKGTLNFGTLFRYQAVNDPIAHAQSRSVKNVLLKIFYVWFFSCLVSLPVIL